MSRKLIEMPAKLLVYLSCVLIVVMMLHVTLDVAAALFNAPIDGTIEVVSFYYMVAVLFLPLGYVAMANENLYVELFTRGLRRRTLNRMDGVIGLVGFGCMLMAAKLTMNEAISSTRKNEMQETGLALIEVWPSRWILPISFFLMALYFLYRGILFFRGEKPPTSGGH